MSDETPQVTLCVTAHQQPYLAECLTSVAMQFDATFELVLCADLTGDPEVLTHFEHFASQIGPRAVRIIEANAGTAGAVRNAAFAAVATPWVTYLDGDDILVPNAMRKLGTLAADGVGDIITAGMFRILSDGTRRPMVKSLTYKPPLWIYQVDPRSLGHWAFFNQPLLIRHGLWQRYPFNEETNREDVDFMLHQLLAGRYIKIPEVMYGYRSVPGSFSARTYPSGDLCEVRYRTGYYGRLFYENYNTAFAENFA